jgi:hypothetical protein
LSRVDVGAIQLLHHTLVENLHQVADEGELDGGALDFHVPGFIAWGDPSAAAEISTLTPARD